MTGDTERSDCWRTADGDRPADDAVRCTRFVDRYGDEWIVRPFESDDREPTLETLGAFGPEDRAMGVPPEAASQRASWLDLLVEEGHPFVAVRDGRVGGFAVYTPTGADDPELAVFVHPDDQERGLGTELCEHVVAAAADDDCEELVLDVTPANRTARRLYERLGFEREDQSAGDGLRRRTHAIRMQLPLDGPAVDEVVQHTSAIGD